MSLFVICEEVFRSAGELRASFLSPQRAEWERILAVIYFDAWLYIVIFLLLFACYYLMRKEKLPFDAASEEEHNLLGYIAHLERRKNMAIEGIKWHSEVVAESDAELQKARDQLQTVIKYKNEAQKKTN